MALVWSRQMSGIMTVTPPSVLVLLPVLGGVQCVAEGGIFMFIPSLCACGCGDSFIPIRVRRTRPQRFIRGHHTRLLRKLVVKTLSPPRRRALYETAGYCCQACGLSMAEQIATYRRRREIHHLNHDHSDNTPGNHKVLCTRCHNLLSIQVRDEVRKAATFRERYYGGQMLKRKPIKDVALTGAERSRAYRERRAPG